MTVPSILKCMHKREEKAANRNKLSITVCGDQSVSDYSRNDYTHASYNTANGYYAVSREINEE